MVALAAMVFVNNAEVDPSKDEYTMSFKICVVVIAMGSLLTIVGFIGCCGAAFENQCLLGTVNQHLNDIFHAQFLPKHHIPLQFVFLMIAALALDVAAAIVVDNNKPTIISETENIAKDMFSKLTEKASQEKADIFQSLFNCCGFKSAKDWENARLEIPASCCKNSTCTVTAVPGSKTSVDLFKEVNIYYFTFIIYYVTCAIIQH